MDRVPSPIMISSPVKVFFVQNTTNVGINGHSGELQKVGNEVWERIHVLEERMCPLTMFIVKVTRAATTIISLLKETKGDLS